MHGRAPFQVLVIPVRETEQGPRFALLRREDAGYWQGVAGGGEAGETPLAAARRETAEETGLDGDLEFICLQAQATVPVLAITGEFTWGPDVLVIPEYTFGVRVKRQTLSLSSEHTEYGWFSLDVALAAVQWDSNRTALWELDQRIRTGKTSTPEPAQALA